MNHHHPKLKAAFIVISQVTIVTILFITITSIIFFSTPHQSVYTYSTPNSDPLLQGTHPIHRDHHHLSSLSSQHNSNKDYNPNININPNLDKDSKSPGIITALHTKALTNLTRSIIPDMFTSLQTNPTIFSDGNTHYQIDVLNATLRNFDIATNNAITIALDDMNFHLNINAKYKGRFLKMNADIDINLIDLSVRTELALTNVKGLLGFNVLNVTVSAEDITVKVNHKLGWLINPLIGDVKDIAIKSIHDALYKALSDLGTQITQGVPMMCDLEQFDGGIDMSLMGDVEYKPVGNNTIYFNGVDVLDNNNSHVNSNNHVNSNEHYGSDPSTIEYQDQHMKKNEQFTHELSSTNPLDRAIVIGFNGETVDIKTRRPLSNVPRNNLTIPLEQATDSNLLLLAIDEYVFNSYYDAWYNRGMQTQELRIMDHKDKNLNTDTAPITDNNTITNTIGNYSNPDTGNNTNNDSKDPSITNPLRTKGLVLHTYTIPITPLLASLLLSSQTTIDGNTIGNDHQNYHEDVQNAYTILSTIMSTDPKLSKILINSFQNQPHQTPNPKDNAVLLIEVSITERPVLHMRDGATTITTVSDQRFVMHNPASLIPYQLLFTITTITETTLTMRVQYDPIVDMFVLIPYLRHLQSSFECTYSLVGPIQLDLLNIVLESITTTVLLPLMNQQLFKGVDLPSPPSFTLVEPDLLVPDVGYLLVKTGLQYKTSISL